MGSLMLNKRVFGAQGFPTFNTHIRPFSSVDSLLMPNEGLFVAK